MSQPPPDMSTWELEQHPWSQGQYHGPPPYQEESAWVHVDAGRLRPPARRSRRGPTSRYLASEGLLDRFAPRWGLNAARSVQQSRSPGWRTLALFLGAILFLCGISLLLGGGYTSIQGLRIPLQRMGLPVSTAGFPSLQWWIWPLGVGFVEIVAKRFDGLRMLWWAAYVFDGTTTAIFLSTGIASLLASYGRPVDTIQIGAVSALLGLLVAVLAEQIVLASLCVLRAALRPVR